MTGILGELIRETIQKIRKDTIVYTYCFIHTLYQRIGDVEINTIWHFRHTLQVQIAVNSVPFRVQSGTGIRITSAEMSDDCVSKFLV